MTLDLVLTIIKLSLEVTLEAMRGMTDDQKMRMWARHDAQMKFWHAWAMRLATALPSVKVDG